MTPGERAKDLVRRFDEPVNDVTNYRVQAMISMTEEAIIAALEEKREAYAKMLDQEISKLSGEMLDYRMIGRDLEAQAVSIAGARLEKIAARIRAGQ